jgi:Flp pilus assembly protein TadB
VNAVVPVALGVAWGALLAAPLVRRARRASASDRMRVLRTAHRARGAATLVSRLRAQRALRELGALPGVVPIARAVRALVDARTARREQRLVERELPVTVDLLAVAVGAGCTPFVAVEVTERWAPDALAACLEQVGRDCALGATFAAALDAVAMRLPSLRPLVDALLASERYGAPVGSALARLAVEQRAVVRRRAEARARTVPVRLLFPLVFLVLPAFGLLTVVPALVAGFAT